MAWHGMVCDNVMQCNVMLCNVMLCMYVCVRLSACLPVCRSVCLSVSIYLSMYVGMYVCTYVPMYLCTYVPMYVCTYVPMYEWMYVNCKQPKIINTYTRTHTHVVIVCMCILFRMRDGPLVQFVQRFVWRMIPSQQISTILSKHIVVYVFLTTHQAPGSKSRDNKSSGSMYSLYSVWVYLNQKHLTPALRFWRMMLWRFVLLLKMAGVRKWLEWYCCVPSWNFRVFDGTSPFFIGKYKETICK